MSTVDTFSVSRRQFLAGCVGCATAAATVIATPVVAKTPGTESDSLGSRGEISSEGRASIAAVDRLFAQQRAPMQQTVSAVGDLGLDPSGGTPINQKLEAAISGMSNTRLVFPSDGTFLISDQVSARPNGPIEFAGNGCSFVLPPHTVTKSLTFELPSGSSVHDIVIDQSAPGARQEFGVQTDGTVRVTNVTIKGYVPAKRGGDNSEVNAMLSPIARTPSAMIQIANFTALAGTAAGIHDQSDLPASSPENTLESPAGIWVGRSTLGTIQFINPKLSGWSNGIYGGRTKGKVEIRGGTFANNFNANVRVGGGSIVDGTSVLLDDRQWSKNAHPGPFSIGHEGVQALRVDAKHGNLTDPVTFRNLHVVANSMSRASSLIDFESESGPGILKNCLVENHLDEPVFQGESPAGGVSQSNILVENCLIRGTSSADVMEMMNRPQSRIQNTCIMLPNIGSDAITGAEIGPGVGFGRACSAGGLTNSSAGGRVGNLSAMNLSAVNGSVASLKPPDGNQNGGIIKAMVSAVFLTLGALAGVGMIVLAFVALALAGIMVISYLVIDE